MKVLVALQPAVTLSLCAALQKSIKGLEEQLAVLKDRFMFLTQTRRSVTGGGSTGK